MKSLMFVLLFIIQAISAQEKCKLQNGHDGICTEITNCPSAQEGMKKNILPTSCRLENNSGLVCCEAAKQSKSQKMCEKWSKLATNASSNVEGSAKEFPHMAALGFTNSENKDVLWACGGSLISENFILTAAHCARPHIGNVQVVRLGDYNLKTTTDDAKPEDFQIKRIIRHPDYKIPSKYDDIALLELENPVTFNDYIKPACLQSNEQILSKNWITTGWTALDFAGEQVEYLRKFLIKEFTNEECNKSFEINNRRLKNGITEKQICAGDDNAVICQGIGGSPLQVKNDLGSYNIIGVSSFGKACGVKPVSPDVFTRVSSYVDWIESVVWP